MKAIIKSIERQYVLDNTDYRFILENLGKPLDVFSITFDEGTGKIWNICVRMNNVHNDVVLLFIENNGVKYELIGELPMRN